MDENIKRKSVLVLSVLFIRHWKKKAAKMKQAFLLTYSQNPKAPLDSGTP